MAWIFFWIVFAALTITSAYIYPYQRYQGQIYGAPQYRREGDWSLEQVSSIHSDHQESSDDSQLNYQERRDESSLWSPDRPIGRSIPVENHGRDIQDDFKDEPIYSGDQLTRNSLKFLAKTYPNVVNRRGEVDSDDSLLSLGSKPRSRNMFIPQVSEECEKAGICENSPDYPHEYVEALLAKLSNENIRFNLDVATPDVPDRKHPGNNESLLLCKPKATIMYPDKVRTKSGQWVFVINGKENKIQGFRGTRCFKVNSKCDNIVYFVDGYEPTCVQKMMDRSMWALDNNGAMLLVTAGVPSCCVCELKVTKQPEGMTNERSYL